MLVDFGKLARGDEVAPMKQTPSRKTWQSPPPGVYANFPRPTSRRAAPPVLPARAARNIRSPECCNPDSAAASRRIDARASLSAPSVTVQVFSTTISASRAASARCQSALQELPFQRRPIRLRGAAAKILYVEASHASHIKRGRLGWGKLELAAHQAGWHLRSSAAGGGPCSSATPTSAATKA